MKFKKILCGVLSGVMALSLLTACGKKGGNDVQSDLTGPKPYENQVEIKIPVYDRGMQGQAPVDNNYWTKYVQTQFGDKYNIKVTYVPIPRKEDVSTFNKLLAAKEQPDLLFSYDYPTMMSFYSRGAFQEVDDAVLSLYAPTFMENTKQLDEYTKVENKRMFVAATRPLAYNWVTLVRQDWLDKADLKMPTNQDEYVNMLRRFKELKLGGENTIPQTQSLSNAYLPNYEFREYPMSEEDNAMYSDITVASLTYDATKKKLQHMNKLYNEGLVSPEWMLDKDGNKMQADFASGKAGVYGFYLSQNPPVIQTLMQNSPDAKISVLGVYADVIKGNKPVARAEWPFGMISGISKDCKNPEAVLMLLEWMSQPENLSVMQNGIEGKTYNMQNDMPVLVTDYSGEDRLNYNSNKDMWCLVTEGKDYGSDEKNLSVQKTTYAPEGYEYLIEQSYDVFQEKMKYWYTDFLFDRSIESLSKYGETLLSKWQVIQVDLVTCKPDEFDAKYEAACKEYLSSGYQEVLDEKAAAYKDMKSK